MACVRRCNSDAVACGTSCRNLFGNPRKTWDVTPASRLARYRFYRDGLRESAAFLCFCLPHHLFAIVSTAFTYGGVRCAFVLLANLYAYAP